ncbi:phospho-N-acetylmuramoyl-pentapeptide-transferase [Prochlorococcus sp. MIT 1300]|uniref:phospho-N-acetylmuramoyl-pentapeptide- transferase n=1 Tax=Prochlorococcus sp. MIT 1300 TaxID=3096218 RepID=UPI0039BF0340
MCLVIVIFGATFLADTYATNSNLKILLLVSSAISVLLTWWTIPMLKALKVGQVVREDGPQSHLEKSGTPTMGGLIVVPAGIIIANLIHLDVERSEKILAISFITLGYMIIGVVDDWTSMTKQKSTGLTANKKIILQTILGIIFLILVASKGLINESIAFPFGLSWNAGILIWPLALFVLIAESNATNLTDGLDGLASGCGSLVFAGIALQLTLREDTGDHHVAAFCIVMSGIWLGFLVQNKKPAKLFMGDAGSLAMGASLASTALLTNSLWALFIMGGVFLVESLSVITQVLFFKLTKRKYGIGRRLFKMAPLHHHFELIGIRENKIVHHFWLATFLLFSIALATRPTL